MKILVLFLFIAFSLHSQSVFVIDNQKAIEGTVPLSTFASGIEYVPLETTSECLLEPHSRYYVTDKYIVAVSMFRAAYLFDRKTGRYIHEITRHGEAPGEFAFKCEDQYGLKNDILYINNDRDWEGIHIKTKESVGKIRKPVSVYHAYNFISNPWPYKDSLYLGYVNNITGQVKTRLVIFNSEGKVQKEFDNPVLYEQIGHDKPFFHGVYYEYDGHTYFKQYQGNDTIYRLSDYALVPHIVFDWNKTQKLHQQQPVFSENQVYISYFFENDRYIIYDCKVNGPFIAKETYQCLYNKEDGTLRSSRKQSAGFLDDIDRLGEICPVVATNTELVDVISAEQWLEWEEKKRKMPVDIELDFDSNPVLRIVHVKE